MSISIPRFQSHGSFLTYDPFKAQGSHPVMFHLQCRCCGFEPEGAITAPRLCPKCHGAAWERFARPGSILEQVDRS